MYHFVERRRIWFTLSLLAILPGIIFMIMNVATTGSFLPLSIDYTGGTLWELRFPENAVPSDVRQVFVDADFIDTTVFNIEDDRTVQIKLKTIDVSQKEALLTALEGAVGTPEELSFRSIGPSIGSEVSSAALVAVIVASLLILLYIAFVFRSVPNSFRYGACAVVALVHDVLIMLSFLCIMNWILGWEIDALFLTATLTVIGFSVNDTIVVFDRLRENLKRYRGEVFATVANRSLIETAQRSVATQVTALFVLVAILVLGGATLQKFMAVLIVGLVSGTYSSMFNATPILVAWEERSLLPSEESVASMRSGRTAVA